MRFQILFCREFRENMKVFSQFLTSSEHEQLINNIEREKELRHRLSELMRYRSLGLTTQEEVIHQEQHMAYQKQQQLKQSKSVSMVLILTCSKVFFFLASLIVNNAYIFLSSLTCYICAQECHLLVFKVLHQNQNVQFLIVGQNCRHRVVCEDVKLLFVRKFGHRAFVECVIVLRMGNIVPLD
jgi:hypothetical protein